MRMNVPQLSYLSVYSRFSSYCTVAEQAISRYDTLNNNRLNVKTDTELYPSLHH